MSHAVAPADLATTAQPYGMTPFLLYAGDDGSARVNHVAVSFADTGEGDDVVVHCAGYGRGVERRVEAGAQLSLLWPATVADQFSLIADGTGDIADEVLSITISGAVLHRPAPTDGNSASC